MLICKGLRIDHCGYRVRSLSHILLVRGDQKGIGCCLRLLSYLQEPNICFTSTLIRLFLPRPPNIFETSTILFVLRSNPQGRLRPTSRANKTPHVCRLFSIVAPCHGSMLFQGTHFWCCRSAWYACVNCCFHVNKPGLILCACDSALQPRRTLATSLKCCFVLQTDWRWHARIAKTVYRLQK